MTMAAMLVLGLLAMVQRSASIRTLPFEGEPLYGLITTTLDVETALNASSGYDIASYEDILGRRFVLGTFYRAPVVYCRTTSNPSIQTALTLQIMAENFNLKGVILLGNAGALNLSLNIGDVVVPKYVAYSGLWTWESLDSNVEGELIIADFNVQANVQNSLASIKFEKSDVVYEGGVVHTYWLDAYQTWLNEMSKVVIDTGDVVVGLNSSTSDIYVKNAAYGEFLYKMFGAASADRATGGVGLAAKGNDINFMSILGISNKAGSDSTNSQLAASNVIKALIGFFPANVKNIRYVTEK